MKINQQELTPGQREQFSDIMGEFISQSCQCIPSLIPHFHSGGTIKIMTLSGVTMEIGFEPQKGGLYLPGGIRPKQ